MAIDCKTYRHALTTGARELTEEEVKHGATCDECFRWSEEGIKAWREANPELALLVKALVVDISSNPEGLPKKGRGQA